MDDQLNISTNTPEWEKLSAEMLEELHHILNYWIRHTVDHKFGGYTGRIDQTNTVDLTAPKGSVLNARILWTFSAAHRITGNPVHLEMATRAFNYICDYFTDPDYGGLYWSVDYQGNPLDTHKQVYAQAFGIYGMSEYYRASGDPQALVIAREWYTLIEQYSRDKQREGYIDAFSREWSSLSDMRLSEKDENAEKTMNTHLHIVEAYANLYEVWPDPTLKADILSLLNLFDDKIIRKKTFHLGLFFTRDWKSDDELISYGHDIEAAWLLQSCAESVQDKIYIQRAKENALAITNAAMEGLDEDGGLWYEFNVKSNTLIAEKHWWPQSEALIGFCNAWQLTGDERYRNALYKNWQFIRNHILDPVQGEWFWGIDREKNNMPDQDKAGLWKCPYHNSRACLELIKRISRYHTGK